MRVVIRECCMVSRKFKQSRTHSLIRLSAAVSLACRAVHGRALTYVVRRGRDIWQNSLYQCAHGTRSTTHQQVCGSELCTPGEWLNFTLCDGSGARSGAPLAKTDLAHADAQRNLLIWLSSAYEFNAPNYVCRKLLPWLKKNQLGKLFLSHFIVSLFFKLNSWWFSIGANSQSPNVPPGIGPNGIWLEDADHDSIATAYLAEGLNNFSRSMILHFILLFLFLLLWLKLTAIYLQRKFTDSYKALSAL